MTESWWVYQTVLRQWTRMTLNYSLLSCVKSSWLSFSTCRRASYCMLINVRYFLCSKALSLLVTENMLGFICMLIRNGCHRWGSFCEEHREPDLPSGHPVRTMSGDKDTFCPARRKFCRWRKSKECVYPYCLYAAGLHSKPEIRGMS